MNTKLLTTLLATAFAVISLPAADAADEKVFVKHMKQVGKANKDFKTNLEARNAAAIEKDATATAESYAVMAAFFKAHKTDDAVKWSDDSTEAARATAAAAKARDWEKVKSSWGAVGKNCKACHDKYREKLEDGGYKIKL